MSTLPVYKCQSVAMDQVEETHRAGCRGHASAILEKLGGMQRTLGELLGQNCPPIPDNTSSGIVPMLEEQLTAANVQLEGTLKMLDELRARL